MKPKITVNIAEAVACWILNPGDPRADIARAYSVNADELRELRNEIENVAEKKAREAIVDYLLSSAKFKKRWA